MTADLKTQLTALEEEFGAMRIPLIAMQEEWDRLREQLRPIEVKMKEVEDKIDAIRFGGRYRELLTQLPHLRKAVGQ